MLDYPRQLLRWFVCPRVRLTASSISPRSKAGSELVERNPHSILYDEARGERVVPAKDRVRVAFDELAVCL